MRRSFDGRVAIVTGAGHGLGRAHARAFAERGARVLVNDLGGSTTGDGASPAAADRVVEEIRAAGGEAVANHGSVEEGHRVVEAALDHFGRVDIVVNNAGILRDKSFHKMSPDDWERVYRVHVLGSFRVTHAAWPHLRDQQYGRVVMTASAAGIYGNFGQANYSMAKLGLFGFAQTLAVEGANRGIRVNTIAPIAGSRMTETIMPQELVDALRPEYVSGLVLWLCHEDCEETGGLFEVGGGFVGKLRWERSAGRVFRLGRAISVEDIEKNWREITTFEAATHPRSVAESMTPILENVSAGPGRGGNALIDVDAALAHRFEPRTSSYTPRDVALYALSVGAAQDPLDPRELQLVYELHGDGFRVLPTFGVIPAVNHFLVLAEEGRLADGLNFGFERVLHGEQHIELVRPLPPKADLRHETRIKNVFDKGKHALIEIEIRSSEADGPPLMVNTMTLLVRGAGGWGGERGPAREENRPTDRAPDAVVEQAVPGHQALLYRLSGDWNPLHADPAFARAVGFERPILHGLCTMGYAVRHVIASFADHDPRRVRRLSVRMSRPVYPGDTLRTEMWRDGDRVWFQTRVDARNELVLAAASVDLFAEDPTASVDHDGPAR